MVVEDGAYALEEVAGSRLGPREQLEGLGEDMAQIQEDVGPPLEDLRPTAVSTPPQNLSRAR